jgi:hypothetical protein
MLVRVRQRAPIVTEPAVAWVPIQAALRYAIPTPVRGLLEQLSDFDQ